MNTWKLRSLVLLWTVGAVVAGPVALAQDEDGADDGMLSDTSCLVRISYDADVMPLDDVTVMGLLESAGVHNAAIRAVLPDVPPEQWEDISLVFEESDAPGEDVIAGRLYVENVPGGPTMAEKLLADVCKRLRAALETASEADHAFLTRRIKMARQEYEESEAELEQLLAAEQQLCAEAGRAWLSRAEIRDEVQSMRNQVREIEADLVARSARREAIAKRIAELGQQADGALEHDQVLVELEHVRELKEQKLERMRALVESGQASSNDLSDAMEELARVRTETIDRREHARMAAGGDQLAGLNADLGNTAIETAETQARLGMVQQRLAEIEKRDVLGIAARYEREVGLRLNFVRDGAREAAEKLYELQRQLRSLHAPEMIVIGGQTSET